MQSLEEKVFQFIQDYQLFQLNDKVLLACSGGSDSMALLKVLHSLKCKLVIAHVNFSLRGGESDSEEEFVKHAAAQLNIPFYSIRFDTKEYAKEHGISIEMAARNLRYEWFEKLRKEENCSKIITAHHLRDSVETSLLNIIKGAGLRGMRGIPSQNGFIVRPFSEIKKRDIEKYIKAHSIDFKIDSSNNSNDYQRNKIRNQILPITEEINPDYENTFQQWHHRNSEIQDLVDCFIQENFEIDILLNKSISIESLLKFSFKELILFELIRPFGFNDSIIKDISNSLSGQSGKQFFSDSHVLIKDRTHLLIQEKQDEQKEEFLSFELDEIGSEINLGTNSFVFSYCDAMETKNENTAYVDFSKIVWPLIFRKAIEGDSFQPFGMDGKTKKIQDFFTDNKYSLFEKKEQWILIDSESKILWLVGKRIDHRFKVDLDTKKILRIDRNAI